MKLFSTNLLIKISIAVLEELVKRTDNKLDDKLLQIVKEEFNAIKKPVSK